MPISKPLPPADVLHRLFSYEPETGLLTRRENGKLCAAQTGHGYIRVSVAGEGYTAHRVIWVMMTGESLAADVEIDHKNRRRDDNRWCNLRKATIVQQRANAVRPNAYGHRGIWHDAETLPYSEIENVYRLWRADPQWGAAKWCAIQRKQQPQKPVIDRMKKAGVWDTIMENLGPNTQDAEVKEYFREVCSRMVPPPGGGG